MTYVIIIAVVVAFIVGSIFGGWAVVSLYNEPPPATVSWDPSDIFVEDC